MRTPFLPFSLLYGSATALRNAMYDRGWLRARSLRGPVVSVGNIAVGGAGKTPFVLWLGERLQQRGIPFDVLSRGYGRKSRGVFLVDPAGSPRDFGDEPLLIAQRLRVPVVVGESRFAAGKFAEEKFGARLHLLDDGFQHRELARDLDIVLLSLADISDRLLPVGRLREPLSALKRAHAIVSSEALPPTFTFPHLLLSRSLDFDRPPDVPVLAFCGIAKPESFFAQLQTRGIRINGCKAFRDHHAYSERDIDELLRVRKESNAEGFVTTEKDLINLGELQSRLQPLFNPRVTMKVDGGEALIDRIAELARSRA